MSLYDESFPHPESPQGKAWRKRCRVAGQSDPYGARWETPGSVIAEAESIAATVPLRAFYDDQGSALLLGDDYAVRINPPNPDDYDRNPRVHTAYLATQPITAMFPREAESDLAEYVGWEPGFEC